MLIAFPAFFLMWMKHRPFYVLLIFGSYAAASVMMVLGTVYMDVMFENYAFICVLYSHLIATWIFLKKFKFDGEM